MKSARYVAALLATTILVAPASAALAQAHHHGHAPAASAPASAVPQRNLSFAHERSDLTPDAAARFGRLPNGMRYVIYRNATPPGEASIRLRVDAGSLMETDRQLGLAHFIEHMAFNGTKNVPEGEMIKILERYGLAFGPDTNAYTSFEETVYMLDLPDVREEVVDTALMLMRETAGNITFDAAAIDRERGVVLGEERVRSSPAFRALVEGLRFGSKGQLLGDRLPIGSTEILRTAPRQEFVDFYNKFYRPERTTLVVVGDIDPAAIESKIRARFADWQGVGPAANDPDFGPLAPRGFETRAYVEAGAPLQASLSWTRPYVGAVETKARWNHDVREQLALAVLNRRLNRIGRQADAPFTAASAGVDELPRTFEATELNITPKPGKLNESVAAVEQEVRRFVQFGVQQAELDREITELRSRLRAAVDGAGTRRNPLIAMSIVATLNTDEVFTSPAQNLALFEEAVAGFTAAQANELGKALFAGQGPLLYATSPEPLAGGEAALAAAYQASTRVAVAAPTVETAKAWTYTSFGAAAQPANVQTDQSLGVTTATFPNGVRLVVRPNAARKDEIWVRARFAGGRTALPTDREMQTWIWGGAFTEGGLKDLTAEEMSQALTGKIYGANLAISDDAVLMSGRTRPADFATQLQVLAAYTTAPGWRPEGFQRVRGQADNLWRQLESSPDGVFARDGARTLRGGDKRWGFSNRAAVDAAQPSDLQSWLSPILASAPLEIVIVGDVDPQEAIRQVGATFGALPARAAQAPRLSGSDRLRFASPAAQAIELEHKGRADQGLAYVAWPTDDFYDDMKTARTMTLLQAVMRLRLIDEVREKQGASYGASSGGEMSEVFDEFGLVNASAPVKPEAFAQFFETANTVAADLAARPIEQDELDRARRPILEQLERDQAGNEFWLGRLTGSAFEPRKLESIRNQKAMLESITAADIQAAARRFLKPETAVRIVARPAPGAPAGGQ